MNLSRRPKVYYYSMLAIGIVAVSFSAILVKWSDAPASVIAMYRLLFTVVMLTPVTIRELPALRHIKARTALKLIASGICLALHFLFWMESLKYTSVASSLIIIALQPIFVMAGTWLIYQERPRLYFLFCSATALTGTVFITGGDWQASHGAALGDIFSLIGTIALALYMVIGQDARQTVSTLSYNWCVFLIAGLCLGLVTVLSRKPFSGYSSVNWTIFVLLAVVTIFGHALFNWLLPHVGAVVVAMSNVLEPAGAILLAWLLLRESVSLPEWIGGILVVSSVLIFLHSDYSRKVTLSNHDIKVQ